MTWAIPRVAVVGAALSWAACTPLSPVSEPTPGEAPREEPAAAVPAVDPDRYRQVRHPPERGALRIHVWAPDLMAPGDNECFAVTVVNDGPSGFLMFSGGAGSVGVELLLRTPEGTIVRALSRGHPPLAGAVDRQMGSGEAVVVARRWDLTGIPGDPAPGFEGDYPPDGDYLLEGFLLTREYGRLSATTRLTIRTGATTRTAVPDLCR
jgi:hypothetical protein